MEYFEVNNGKEYAAGSFVEQTITPDGVFNTSFIRGNSRQMVERLVGFIGEETGLEPIGRPIEIQRGNRRSFGLGGLNWRAVWEPTGPTPLGTDPSKSNLN